MNSFVHEAKTLERAICEARSIAELPEKFFVKIVDSGNNSWLWWNNRPVKILFSYNLLAHEAPKQYANKFNDKTKQPRGTFSRDSSFSKSPQQSIQGNKRRPFSKNNPSASPSAGPSNNPALKQPLERKYDYPKNVNSAPKNSVEKKDFVDKKDLEKPIHNKKPENAFAFNAQKTYTVNNVSNNVYKKDIKCEPSSEKCNFQKIDEKLTQLKSDQINLSENIDNKSAVSDKKPLSFWTSGLVSLAQKYVFEITKDFNLISGNYSIFSSIDNHELIIHLGPVIFEEEIRNKHITSSIVIIVMDMLKRDAKENVQNLRLTIKYDQ